MVKQLEGLKEIDRRLADLWRPPQAELEVVNSEEFQKAAEAVHEGYARAFGDGPMTMWWQERNTKILERLLTGIEGSSKKRVLVTVGAEHKYWLDRALTRRAGVKLVQPATLAPLDVTIIEDQGFRQRRKLFMLLEGREANQNPDGIAIGAAKDALSKLEADDAEVQYFAGMAAYVEHQYEKALDHFQKAAKDSKGKFSVFGLPI